ncbi:hypothetical protein HGRIS_010672 [Hohenbuehelia grisea]|uniref:Pectate lyase n=1 Tax=Hohenbuehelia grisea TaxID=104357 RepID=A0ABR3IXM6_9AGAR
MCARNCGVHDEDLYYQNFYYQNVHHEDFDNVCPFTHRSAACWYNDEAACICGELEHPSSSQSPQELRSIRDILLCPLQASSQAPSMAKWSNTIVPEAVRSYSPAYFPDTDLFHGVPLSKGGDCQGQKETGEEHAAFILQPGASISNVIIGKAQAEGIHCRGPCTVTNVWWEDVCEDAITVRYSITIIFQAYNHVVYRSSKQAPVTSPPLMVVGLSVRMIRSCNTTVLV